MVRLLTYLLTSHTQPVFQNDLAEFVVTWAHSFNFLVGFSFQRVLSYHNIRLHWLSQLSNAREMSISVRDQFIVEETKRATTALLIGMYSVTKNRCSISKFLNITPEPSWLGVWNRHPVSNVTYYLLHFYVFIVCNFNDLQYMYSVILLSRRLSRWKHVILVSLDW